MKPSISTRPLKILHTEAATTFGGQEHRIYKEMMAMRERGHHLEAVCQPDATLGERLRQQGFRVHDVTMPGLLSFLRGTHLVARILRAGNFDVLNTHSRQDTILATVAGRMAGTPLIVRTRHLAKPPGSLLSYTWLPHRVIAISEHVRKLLLDRGVAPHKVATVMTAVNMLEPVQTSSLRTELGLTDDAVIIGSVGHMRTQKGHAELIAAVVPLLTSHPHLHLVIAGDGEPLLTELRKQVSAAGLANRIHLLGRRNDIANLLCGFDIFALATRVEALGTSFIEAAACGLPLIGTRVGGVPETVKDGVNGFLVDLDAHDALQDALDRLIKDSALRRTMGRAAQTGILSDTRFSVAFMAEATEAAYRTWLQERQVA